MSRRLEAHRQNLSNIIGLEVDINKMYELTELELEGHRLAIKHCNGEIKTERFDILYENIKKRVRDAVNGFQHIHFNLDPRGYFLKIDDEYLRKHRELRIETDWGGYGIVSPDWVQNEL